MTAWQRTLAAGVLTLAAQMPQFRSSVDVARFDVVVLDKDRHPIAGLTSADFRVTEDGTPLRVAGFQAVTIPGRDAPARTPATVPPPVAETVTNQREVPGRLVVIVLDRTISHGRPIVTARAAANAAVDALGPNDLGAVLFTSGIAIGRPQGLTADRERLRAAIASLEMGAPPSVAMTLQGLTRGPADAGGACSHCPIETLTNVANALGPANDDRKMILFIGEDLAISEAAAVARAPENRGMIRGPATTLLRALDRANVTIHVIDPRGLETTGPAADNTPAESADARMNRQGNLQVLPDYTGGRAILAANEPERLISSVFAEDRTYYVLAVEREPARKDRQRHSVRIDVAGRDATVLARTAYYDADSDTARRQPADPLERALGELLPQADLPLRMTLAATAARPGSVEVTLATARSTPARAEVLVGVFDLFSKQVGSERARVELTAGAGGADIEWTMHLDPKPGRYEVRAAVKIGDAIGSVIGYVDVPPPARRADTPAADTTRTRTARTEPSAAAAALLRRTGEYLERYSDPANGVLLEERYNQYVLARPLRVRELRSELLILPDAAEGWVQLRDVLAVDGKPVTDRADRLIRLFTTPGDNARAQARRIADEGARYNLSGAIALNRTLNQPMAALLFLRNAAQGRSSFQLQGGTGGDEQRVSFVEWQAPTLIGTTGDEPARGDFWIDRASGGVKRLELRVVSRSKTVTASATILVTFKHDSKSDLLLPVTMVERYDMRNPSGSVVETIQGEAWYSKPRQFKAAAGVLP